MKLILFFILVSLFQVQAMSGFAQNISLSKTNVSLVEFFRDVKKQTNYTVITSSEVIHSTPLLNVEIKDKTLNEALTQILSPIGLTYVIENKTIIVRKEKNIKAASTSKETSVEEVLQMEIGGKVTGKNGMPISGVSISVRGTESSTVTDANGAYSITIPNDPVDLVFSYIGYTTLVENTKGRSVINVSMIEQAEDLETVVVTGYSAQRKADITGSVSVVKVEDLKSTPASNFGQQLQGKAAGVTVGTQGAPGSSSTIRIRGIGTVNSNGPLYIIDGVSTRNQDLNSINPNDIESMQILKDASSASIYGAQASNGVIIITTKKGKLGSPKINYDSYVSITKPIEFLDVLNTKDRVDLMWKGKLNAAEIRGTNNTPSHPQFGTGLTPTIPKYIIPHGENGQYDISDWREDFRITELSQGTDWYKESTQDAPTHNQQITISGANDFANYLLGFNYYNQEGIFLNSYYKRYSTRINTEFKTKDWLRFGENLTINFSNDNRFTDQSEGNALSWSYRMVPWVPVYDIAGQFAGSKANGSGNGQNPVSILERGRDNKNNNLRLLGNLYGEIDILPELRFRSNFGIDHGRSHSYAMKRLDPEFSESLNRNTFSEYANYNSRIIWSNTFNYEKTFSEKHNIKALIGSEFIRDGIGRDLNGSRIDYLFEDNVNTWTLGNGSSREIMNSSNWNGEMALFGIFSRVDYSYDDRYLLTGIVRRDGSSRFSESNRYGVFPSISFGWRISQENFLKEVGWVDDMKFRVGYGVTGNSEIPRITNWADEYLTNPGETNYDFDGSQGSALTGFGLSRIGNPDTKWETTKMLNIGMDFTLFNGALDGNVEYYIKNTSDMLVVDNYSSLAGSGTPPYVNLGNMENKGWDVAIGHKGKMGAVNYNIGVNVSTYKNEVVSLNKAAGTRIFGGATRFGNVTITQEGSPISQFFGYNILGFYNNEQEVIDYKGSDGERNGKTVLPIGVASDENLVSKEWVGKYIFEDVNGDGRINGDDKTIIGNPNPDFTGGVSLGLNYKNFDLSTYLYASVGNEVYNQVKWWTDFQSQDGNRSATMRDRSWEPGKKDALLPILDEGDIYSNGDATSYFVEDGSYLRMQTLSLGYTFPNETLSKIKMNNLRIYFQAVNLFTLTKYTGLDPEVMNSSMGDAGDITKGVDFGRWPQSKQFLFGINFTF